MRYYKRNLIIYSVLLILFAGCGSRNGRNNNSDDLQPVDTTSSSTRDSSSQAKPIVNVYIENSGSMDGFVNGKTQFEAAVYNYLSDIKIHDITDSLNLFYINSEIIPWKEGADADVIADFVDKLEPHEFKSRGGSRKASDIANILRSILRDSKDNDVDILITDGIFSPGRDKDADEYLINQEIGIKTAMAEYIKNHKGAAVIVYQLYSKFTGTYYDKVDNPISVKDKELPFYVWIIGKADYLSQMRKEIPESKFSGSGVKKMFSMISGEQQIDYAVKFKSGNFKVSRNNPKEISNLKTDRNGQAKFSVSVNFDKLLLDEEYLLVPTHYELKNYNIKITPNENHSKYTHTLTFIAEKNKQKNGQLCTKVKIAKPDWDDTNNDDGTCVVERKTYGIKYQINGIYKAFMVGNNDSTYSSCICINIK